MNEAAIIFGIPPEELRKAVREGRLKYFYRMGNDYKFHDASLEANRLWLDKKGKEMLN
ncbi:MAG: hypothetical protein H8D26_09300 [Methanomicrobia archaeon]|nr:hypothetical protein [Methanomicrobia archaeon]